MLLDRHLSPRTQRRGLYLLALACFACSMLLWAWAFLPTDGGAADTVPLPAVRPRATKLATVPPLEDFRSLMSKRMRGPLVDPPPPVKKTAPTPRRSPTRAATRRPPRLDWRLIGTAMESGKSAAILIDRQGKIRVVEQGAKLPNMTSEARIKQIEANRITVSYRGQDVELALPKQPKGLN